MKEMDIFEEFTIVVHNRELPAAIHHAAEALHTLEEKYPQDRANAVLLRWMR